MTETADGGTGREGSCAERDWTGSDRMISDYFRTYMEKVARVLGMADAILEDGSFGRELIIAALDRQRDAYWVLEKTKIMESDYPWLQLVGLQPPLDRGIMTIPSPAERERVYGEIKEKVSILENLLASAEKFLKSSSGFSEAAERAGSGAGADLSGEETPGGPAGLRDLGPENEEEG
ncbi:MAG: hypothetical protein LBW85_13435 [Deltaproteobacteria bacterium]|jgi:hypothetical protein|nr:hypothetical protein [Deltaproteobacteria bacterium]